MFSIQASTNTQFEFENPAPLILSCDPISILIFCCRFCLAKYSLNSFATATTHIMSAELII